MQLIFSRVVVKLDDLYEIRLALRARQSMLVSVPLILTLMAVYHVPRGWLLAVHD
jgi:hypothetical protein